MFYIIEGWVKYILSVCRFYINKTAIKREKICNECRFSKNGFCSRCGCFIKAKVNVNYFLDENNISIGGCPEKKW